MVFHLPKESKFSTKKKKHWAKRHSLRSLSSAWVRSQECYYIHFPWVVPGLHVHALRGIDCSGVHGTESLWEHHSQYFERNLCTAEHCSLLSHGEVGEHASAHSKNTGNLVICDICLGCQDVVARQVAGHNWPCLLKLLLQKSWK